MLLYMCSLIVCSSIDLSFSFVSRGVGGVVPSGALINLFFFYKGESSLSTLDLSCFHLSSFFVDITWQRGCISV